MKFTLLVFSVALVLVACGGGTPPTPGPGPGPDAFGVTKGKISITGKMKPNPKTSLLELQAAVKTAVSRLEP